MSWVKVESSVRTNRKFLQAGPDASWLWLCGVLYCQESLTDGFIPFEALKFLGVDKPKPLIPKLVKARLWEEVEGGWQVHDYLKHNRSSSTVRDLSDKRHDAGVKGGIASGEARREANAKQVASTTAEANAKQPANPDQIRAEQLQKQNTSEQIVEGEFQRFQMAYPRERRKGGYLVETLFFDARKKATLEDLLSALANHVASEQWQTPRLIPGMDTWLKEERWNQRLDPPKQAWRPEEAAS